MNGLPDYERIAREGMADNFSRRRSRAGSTGNSLRVLRPADCAAESPRDYVVKGLLAKGNLAVLIGQPGAGKSLLAPLIGYLIALNKRVFGRRVRQGPVLYIAAEDGAGMVARVQALREMHGDAHDFMLVPQAINLMDEAEADLLLVQALADATRPVLIIVDTLARAFPGLRENESEEMDIVVNVGRRLAGVSGAAVLMVHHPAKNGGETARGHGRLEADADLTMRIEGSGSDDRTVRLGKNRNGTSDATFTFRLHVQNLGQDDDGDPLTAAVAVPVEGRSETSRRAALPGTMRIAMELLERAILTEGRPAPPSPNVPPNVLAVSQEVWRGYCYKGSISPTNTDVSRRKAFNRATNDLQRRRMIGVWDGMVWIALPSAGTGGTFPVGENVSDDVPSDTQ